MATGEPMETDDQKTLSGTQMQRHPANEFNPDFLRFYYGRLFPFAEMHKWLSYGHDGKHPGCDSSFFGRREFSFTLENDIYLRYLSFRDASEMEAAFRDKCPHKIDIGAVYNVDPSKRTAYSSLGGDKVFSPVERELVFDVDMTDYDDIRTCCSGADICLKCWPLMTIAIKVTDTALREDFGFEHLLWVYSGRRGVHCWVSDARARRLTNEQRASITDYFRVYKGSEMNGKKVTLTGPALHPSLSRAYVDVLKLFFEEQILLNLSLLNPDEQYEKVLDMVADESVRAQLRVKWQDTRRSSTPNEINLARWRQLKQLLESGKQKNLAVRRSVEEIVFSYTYPRLDLEVSKSMNHLLKSPFCIHPKTGRVCVPIDPTTCETFNPMEVPTISQLLDELNQDDKQSIGSDPSLVSKDWERTSLAKSIHYFRSSFLEPLLRSCKAELESAHKAKLQDLATTSSLQWSSSRARSRDGEAQSIQVAVLSSRRVFGHRHGMWTDWLVKDVHDDEARVHLRNGFGNMEPRRDDGLIARFVTYLFGAFDRRTEEVGDDKLYSMKASYLDIYNEQVNALPRLDASPREVRWSSKDGFYVENLLQLVDCETRMK